MTKRLDRPHLKPGPKPRPGAARTATPVRPSANSRPVTPVKPSDDSSSSGAPKKGLRDLASEVLGRRGGEERRKREFVGPGAKDRTDEKGKRYREEAPVVDELQAEALATVMGEGEAELGSFFVPDDKAEAFVARVSKMLKHAWKYHFIQHGVNLPSWVLLLLAHVGMGAAMLAPNKDRVGKWWDGLMGKVEKKGEHVPTKPEKPNHKPDGTPLIDPAD